MKKVIILSCIILLMGVLTACNDKKKDDSDAELPSLDVNFIVPETADPGDTVELKAEVTYGGEPVTDADEVLFEIWESGKQDEGEKIDGKNQGDGTYTLSHTFEHEGEYEIFAHTSAHTLHTMPKKQITVGEGAQGDSSSHDGEAHFHTEGFDLNFVEPTDVMANEDIDLTAKIMLDEKPLEDLSVRYEIWPDTNEDDITWADTEELTAGEYIGTYKFPESGTFHIQIHIKDDDELHEHAEYEVTVD